MCWRDVFFFFSSRRRHTRWTGDWSSDVCSSDLYLFFSEPKNKSRAARRAIKPTIIGLQLKTSLSGSSVPESPCATAHPVAGAVSCYSPPAERWFGLHPEADHRRRHPPQGYWASQRYPELPCR